MDPAISAKVAMTQAWRSVTTLAPTLVPNTLATSFAPTPNANTKAKKNPTIMIHKVDACHSDSGVSSIVVNGSNVEVMGENVDDRLSPLPIPLTIAILEITRNSLNEVNEIILYIL